MILCITPNPAVDRTLIVPGFIPGRVHRATQSLIAAGGKGLNVTRAINTLGGKALCIGFAGGYSGRLMAELAEKEGLICSWTWIQSETRTCIILIPDQGDATVFNEPGDPVSSPEWELLREDVRKKSSSIELACISGSLPAGTPVEEFGELIRIFLDNHRQVWVDTSGSALALATETPNIHLKVNSSEISQSLGLEVKDVPSSRRAFAMLLERGIKACVITLGAKGAVLATKEGLWHALPPPIHVRSTVGSGDSFLGGLLAAVESGRGWPEALIDGVAAGSANALSPGGGRFSLEEFEALRGDIEIRSI